MSRNYELLNQIGKTDFVIGSAPTPITSEAAEPSAGVPKPCSMPSSLQQIDGMAKNEITKLVHHLFIPSNAENPRRVAFVCSESGVGNSWICAHAGSILASQTNRSVCLVDCNFRSPGLHELIGVQNHFGLADALCGNGSIRQYSRQLGPNLWMVSCGAMSKNADELLTSDRMRQRMSELGAEFDYVLLDVASLDSCNHGIILGHICDGVVLVLKANSSRRESARQAVQQLRGVDIRVLGAILNQRTFPIPSTIYKLLQNL